MIDVGLIDSTVGKQVQTHTPIDNEDNPPVGLSVYSEPRRIFDGYIRFFSHATQGIEMNVNATTGGTPAIVHDGTDTVAWTGTNQVGTGFIFNSTTVAHAGTKSVSALTGIDGDRALFTAGTAITNIGTYVALSGWIYITSWSVGLPGKEDIEVQAWNGITKLGNKVKIGTYVNSQLFNTWQNFVIPLVDLGLTIETVDSLVFKIKSKLIPPTFYIDDIEWVQTTGAAIGPTVYTIEPAENNPAFVSGIQILMVDAMAGTLANASMPNLAYNQFLGVTILTTGINITAQRRGDIIFSANFKQLSDFLQLPNVIISNSGTDGTNTWATLNLVFDPHPIVLLPNYQDKLTVTINDDLTGLLMLRMSARIFEEVK